RRAAGPPHPLQFRVRLRDLRTPRPRPRIQPAPDNRRIGMAVLSGARGGPRRRERGQPRPRIPTGARHHHLWVAARLRPKGEANDVDTGDHRLNSGILTRADGRSRRLVGNGAGSKGPPVLLLHRNPGSRLLDRDSAATTASELRLLTVDRPDYGGTDPDA